MGDLVVVPTEDGKGGLISGSDPEWMKQGYTLAAKVAIKKRISGHSETDLPPSKRRKDDRKDAPENSEGSVCGHDCPLGAEYVFVRFHRGGETIKAQVPLSNLRLVDAKGEDPTPKASPSAFKGLDFC